MVHFTQGFKLVFPTHWAWFLTKTPAACTVLAGLVSEKLWCCCVGEAVKYKTLASNKLLRVKFPLQKGINKADVSKIWVIVKKSFPKNLSVDCWSSFGRLLAVFVLARGLMIEVSALLSFYIVNLILNNLFDTKVSFISKCCITCILFCCHCTQPQ